MSQHPKDLRLACLRSNLQKLEESLLGLQKTLAKMAAVPADQPGDFEEADHPGAAVEAFAGETFEAAMQAVPAGKTIVSIEHGEGGWKVLVSDD